jgi:hypothetical protein
MIGVEDPGLCAGFVLAAPGISASPSEENMRYFNVMILGPSQSPYEGDKFFFFCSSVLYLTCHFKYRVGNVDSLIDWKL